MRVEGAELRPAAEFRLTTKPGNLAAASFVALGGDVVTVTRRLVDLLGLPNATPVLANWHGERRTDVFLLTVAELRALAAAYQT